MMRPIPNNIFGDYMGPSTSEQGRLIRLMSERPSGQESFLPRGQTPRARSKFSKFYLETELKALKRKGLLNIVESPKKYHLVWEKLSDTSTRPLHYKLVLEERPGQSSPMVASPQPVFLPLHPTCRDFGAGDGPRYEAIRISVRTWENNNERRRETPAPVRLIRWPSFIFQQRALYFQISRPTSAEEVTAGTNSASRNPDVQLRVSIPSVPQTERVSTPPLQGTPR